MKASILKLVLGVGVVIVVQSFMHSGCAIGVFVFGLGGRGTLTLRTSRLGFFLVLIPPFQFFVALFCWAYVDELDSCCMVGDNIIRDQEHAIMIGYVHFDKAVESKF